MKGGPFFGWLASIFGSLGSLICLAALVGVWILSIQVRSSVDDIFSRVSDLLIQVHDGGAEITARVESSRQSVGELKARIQNKVVALAENVELDPGEVRELSADAQLIAGRLRDWVAFAGSAREFIDLVDELIHSTTMFFRADDESREEFLVALESGQQQIGEAVAAFEDLVTQLEQLRENRDATAFEEASQPLFARIDGALARVQELTEDFSEGIAKLEAASSDLGLRIRRRIFSGTLIVSLLMVWLGAGQVCLVRSGVSKIRSAD